MSLRGNLRDLALYHIWNNLLGDLGVHHVLRLLQRLHQFLTLLLLKDPPLLLMSLLNQLLLTFILLLLKLELHSLLGFCFYSLFLVSFIFDLLEELSFLCFKVHLPDHSWRQVLTLIVFCFDLRPVWVFSLEIFQSWFKVHRLCLDLRLVFFFQFNSLTCFVLSKWFSIFFWRIKPGFLGQDFLLMNALKLSLFLFLLNLESSLLFYFQLFLSSLGS